MVPLQEGPSPVLWLQSPRSDTDTLSQSPFHRETVSDPLRRTQRLTLHYSQGLAVVVSFIPPDCDLLVDRDGPLSALWP